jgi:DNA-directed RNA polymerase subunit E'/Rpb7
MALQQIFVDLTLHDIIPAEPWQLNNELYLHLKQNLKNKVEKRCIDAGYICRISDIVDYKDGYMLAEDFSGNVMFKIKYNAKACIVVPNIQIICKINQMVKGIIVANNGPVVVLIKYIDINTNVFKIGNTGNVVHVKSNKQLAQDVYIKITVKSKKSYNGESQLGVIGYIEDLATDEQINEYMYKEYDDDGNYIKAKTINNIVMNEDDGIDDLQTIKPENVVENAKDNSKKKDGYIMDI